MLSDLVNWRDVVAHLGVPQHVMDSECEEGQQRSEAISWWINNCATASWRELANALWSANCPLLAANVKILEGNNNNVESWQGVCVCVCACTCPLMVQGIWEILKPADYY